MNNGGYVMVDCEGLDLTKGSIPQTITGIYEKVQKAMKTGKEIRAYNCTWGSNTWGNGLYVTPISVMAIQIDATTVICTAATLQVTITSSDVITINNLVE